MAMPKTICSFTELKMQIEFVEILKSEIGAVGGFWKPSFSHLNILEKNELIDFLGDISTRKNADESSVNLKLN